MSEWEDEWVSEWVSERMSEWEDEWVRGWVSEWVSERASESVSERMSEWVSEWEDEWVRGWVSERMSEWVSERASERVSQWVRGWVSEWEDECITHYWLTFTKCPLPTNNVPTLAQHRLHGRSTELCAVVTIATSKQHKSQYYHSPFLFKQDISYNVLESSIIHKHTLREREEGEESIWLRKAG